MTDRLISVVDDDASVRSATVDLLASLGFVCEAFTSAESYLHSDAANRTSCLILDVRMPGLTVKVHRTNLMRKMQASSLADLITMATKLGIPEKPSASLSGSSDL